MRYPSARRGRISTILPVVFLIALCFFTLSAQGTPDTNVVARHPRQIAARRRAARSHKASLADRLSQISSSSGEGSDGSDSREQDLKRALTAALGSLSTLSELYHQREARWREEMRQVAEEREQVDLVLRQALG